MSKNLVPINRLSKFFDESDFQYEIDMGRQLIEGDLNFTVILYRVDRKHTTQSDVYGEANKDEIRYLPPVEIKVILNIDKPENKSYNQNSGGLRYLLPGTMTFGVYEEHLIELGVDISFGDYIAYAVNPQTIMYYTVTNDGKITSDNEHTIFGFQGAFRTITCSPTDQNEFRAF